MPGSGKHWLYPLCLFIDAVTVMCLSSQPRYSMVRLYCTMAVLRVHHGRERWQGAIMCIISNAVTNAGTLPGHGTLGVGQYI